MTYPSYATLHAARVLAAVALLITLGLAVVIAFYAYPSFDDYGNAARFTDEGYFNWSGRWATVQLNIAILSRIDPVRYYPPLLLSLMVLHIAGFHAFWRTVLGASVTRLRAAGLALAAFGLLWAGMLALRENIYWFSAGICYQTGLSLLLILIAWMVQPIAEGTGRLRVAARLLVSCGLAILIAGFQELIGLTLIAAVLAGIAIAYRRRASNRIVWTAVLPAAIIGFLIVYLAPGNQVRAQLFPHAGNLALSMRLLYVQFMDCLPVWMFDSRLLAVTLVFVANPWCARLRPGWIDWPGIPWRWLFPVLGGVVMLGWFFGPGWATGGRMSTRVLNDIYTVFLVTWFLTVFAWTRLPVDSIQSDSSFRRTLETGGLLIAAAAFMLTGNTRMAMSDLRHRAPAWHRAMVERDVFIRESKARGERDIVVPQPPETSNFFFVDISDDPEDKPNKWMAMYYGIDSVRLATESEQGE